MGALAAWLLAVATSTTLFTIPAEHRLVEGVATDGESVWVSSVLDRTITVRNGDSVTTIALPADTGLPLGLAWDERRGWLWVATDCPNIVAAGPCARSELVALDRKGRVKRRLSAPGPFHVGDVSAERGKVFVSDSQNGAVWRIDGDRLAAVVAPGVGKSAQGSALTPDGKALIVADYAQGIARIDLATGQRALLSFNGKPLRGVDGLARRGDTFYAIQNGGSVGRLLAFRVTGDAIAVEVIAEGGLLSDPTQVAIGRDGVIAVGDSGWATIDEAGHVRRKGAQILAFPLEPR